MPQPIDRTEGALAREVTGFAFAGAAGFAIDAGLTLVIAHMGWLSPVAARLPATAIAICFTFALNRRWTFRSQATGWLGEFARYVGVSLGGAAINYLFYALFLLLLRAVEFPAAGHPAAIFAGVIVGSTAAAVFNFLGARYVAFASRPSA